MLNNEILENEEIVEEYIEPPKKVIPRPDIETRKRQSKISQIKMQIAQLEKKLKKYDYIGTKIATKRGTVEEYATQIAQMDEWANEINALEDQISLIVGNSDKDQY